jgi:arylsulfatase I/J
MSTPVIDSLVKDGIELDRTYAYHYCSPTRSSLLTGRLPIHVNQLTACGKILQGLDYTGANISGKIYPCSMADARMTKLPEKLNRVGYVSYQIGKWHAGAYSDELQPVGTGFNHSFGYMSGDEDHYTQRNGGGGEFGGVDLWRDAEPAYGENGTSYGTFLWTNEAVMRISQHAATYSASSPMFMYLAYANCHCPLEVPESYQDKSIDSKLRRIYHGMANCMDEGIGNVTQALKDAGMWEDTMVFFTSDNGE